MLERRQKISLLVLFTFCLLISAGYYGRLVLQSTSAGVAIKDLDKYKDHATKEKEFYENF